MAQTYKISSYTRGKARSLGVVVKPSKNKGKKIDVFKDGKKVASIGALGMMDFPSYRRAERTGKVPKGTAAKRRASYKARHGKYRHRRGTPSYYADKLLW
jgi:hypothetical protein